MIESPVLQNFLAKHLQEAVLEVLKDRFGKVPQDVRRLLAEQKNEKQLKRLNVQASRSESLEAFKELLLT